VHVSLPSLQSVVIDFIDCCRCNSSSSETGLENESFCICVFTKLYVSYFHLWFIHSVSAHCRDGIVVYIFDICITKPSIKSFTAYYLLVLHIPIFPIFCSDADDILDIHRHGRIHLSWSVSYLRSRFLFVSVKWRYKPTKWMNVLSEFDAEMAWFF
jgi:hypothetical protein